MTRPLKPGTLVRVTNPVYTEQQDLIGKIVEIIKVKYPEDPHSKYGYLYEATGTESNSNNLVWWDTELEEVFLS